MPRPARTSVPSRSGGGTLGFAAVVGSVLFPVLRTVNISVVDGVGGGPDQYTVFASEGVQDGLSDYFSASILLQDDGGTAIAGDALPLTLPDLSQFGVRSFALSGQYTNLDGVFMQYEVLGQLTPVGRARHAGPSRCGRGGHGRPARPAPSSWPQPGPRGPSTAWVLIAAGRTADREAVEVQADAAAGADVDAGLAQRRHQVAGQAIAARFA